MPAMLSCSTTAARTGRRPGPAARRPRHGPGGRTARRTAASAAPAPGQPAARKRPHRWPRPPAGEQARADQRPVVVAGGAQTFAGGGDHRHQRAPGASAFSVRGGPARWNRPRDGRPSAACAGRAEASVRDAVPWAADIGKGPRRRSIPGPAAVLFAQRDAFAARIGAAAQRPVLQDLDHVQAAGQRA